MPIPLLLGIAAGIAAAVGAGAAINGAVKMSEANDTIKSAETKQNNALRKLKSNQESSFKLMDDLGKQELLILKSFEKFSATIERIQGRPEFKAFQKGDVSIPKFKLGDLKDVSVGAGILLGAAGGAAVGTLGGFAAAGATTAAVAALGTASTGTAIASLSGAAATNATLAALGGGAIAAGGGGIALGTTLLGAATLGVGLLVGGIIFSITGSSLADKADEAYCEACHTEEKVNNICKYLSKLKKYVGDFKKTLTSVEDSYKEHMEKLDQIVNVKNKTRWRNFSEEEKLLTQNTVLLVGLLYEMCKVKLVMNSRKSDGVNQVNVRAISNAKAKSGKLLENI